MASSFGNQLFENLFTQACGRNGIQKEEPWFNWVELLDLDKVVELILLSYFARGHVLLEGINGLSKTVAAKQINGALMGKALRAFYTFTGFDSMQRISGSPDLSPPDILGADTLDEANQSLVYQDGPILRRGLVFLADELNRSPPKTQSALLQPMAERKVIITTNDSKRQSDNKLPSFFTIATQNPEFHEGTFPLPEALLDRFMIKLRMPYTPSLEKLLLESSSDPRERLRASRTDRTELDMANRKNALETLKGELRERAGEQEYACLFTDKLEPSIVDKANVEKEELNQLHKELRNIEEKLLSQRIAYLRSVQQDSQVSSIGRNEVTLISRIVYFTWSQESAQLLTPEITKRVSHNSELQSLVEGVVQGASPRAALAMRDLAKARAWSRSDIYDAGNSDECRDQFELKPDEDIPEDSLPSVTTKDIRDIAPAVLNHRVTMRFRSELTPEKMIEELVSKISWQI